MNDTVHFEKTLSSETLFEGRVITLTKDTALLENGKTATREVVHHHGGACILPYFADGTICMVRQFRYAMQQQLWELPAGKLEKGEDPFAAAKRELEEECGLTADNYISLGEFYPTVGYDTEVIYTWVATGLHETKMHLDADEFLTPRPCAAGKGVSDGHERRDQGRQDHCGHPEAEGSAGRGQAVILYEDAALVVLDKPAGLSSEEGVPAAARTLERARCFCGGGAPVGHRGVRVDGLCPHPGSCRRPEPSGHPKSGRLRRAGRPRRGQSRRAAVRQAVPCGHRRYAGRAAARRRALAGLPVQGQPQGQGVPGQPSPQGGAGGGAGIPHPCHGRGRTALPRSPCTPGAPIRSGCSLPAANTRCTATANMAAARRAASPCKAAACALCTRTPASPWPFLCPLPAAAPWKEFLELGE